MTRSVAGAARHGFHHAYQLALAPLARVRGRRYDCRMLPLVPRSAPRQVPIPLRASTNVPTRAAFGSSRPRSRFAPILVALALLAASATDSAASNDPTTALEKIYREQNIQRQLPIAAPPDLPDPVYGIPTVFGWLILAGVALGAAALALWLMAVNLDAVGQKRRKRRAGRNPDDAPPEPGMQVPGDWLRTADNLARQGRFAEAVHLLLLGVLGLARVADDRTSEAETAREIARAHVGPHAGRLHALVRASELVHFGGRPATQEQFDDCRHDAVEIHRAASPAPL